MTPLEGSAAGIYSLSYVEKVFMEISDTDSLNLALPVTTSFASSLSIHPMPQTILLSAIKFLVSYIFHRHSNSSENVFLNANFNISMCG